MAQLKTPAFVPALKKALIAKLKAAGVQATVKCERVGPTKFYRFQVLSEQFVHMRPTERQQAVWSIVEDTVVPDDRLLVSMIMTLAPSEIAGHPIARRKAS